IVNPKTKPKMQMTMPKSRSLWPSIPRKVTWERSGSFKLASPPASSARADTAPSNVRMAAAPNLANLQLRAEAFASQVSIHNPPYIICSQGNYMPGQQSPTHFFGRALFGAAEERIVHIPPGRSRRAPAGDYPQKWLAKRLEDGPQGLRKTPIYNILPRAGQTGHPGRKQN